MSLVRRLVLCSVLFSALFVSACGVDEQVERQSAPLSITVIPSWIRYFPTQWGCDQTMSGRFIGLDSAHMYRFPGKLGYRYTFSFKASYHPANGSAIAIYSLDNGARVAIERAPYKNEVSVTYTATRNVTYLVAVYSLWPRTNGRYSLHAACERTKFCLEYETTAADGTPYRNFYAMNVSSEVEAQQQLARAGDTINVAIRPGSCASQSRLCTKLYSPVCADTPAPKGTHGNLCEFKAHVRSGAGEDGQFKGHWDVGACDAEGQFCGGIAGLPCPEGYNCVLSGSYPDAGGSCTKVTCDPKKEWARNYVSTDPNQCKAMRFSCPENTQHFFNDCGCGCEQAATCPEYFNCMPPSPCDEAGIKKKCPYSQIAY
ncbi:MAG: hypothetical protein H6728_02815 [Myxococcales bacterium]|nr:hypothetical protein [Myxococcales bacterium]MCB9641985.1 hypothetical protein [Myxococcales bacterium]